MCWIKCVLKCFLEVMAKFKAETAKVLTFFCVCVLFIIELSTFLTNSQENFGSKLLNN